MNELMALQQRFLDYLRHGTEEVVNDVVGANPDECARRLSIYYNAYRIRLRTSIETDHPVLGRYLGDDGFEQMATAYVDAYPSTHISLRNFCDRLPEFLRKHPPFADHPVLSEIAMFERLLMDVFDAADAPRLEASFLSALPAERWPELTVAYHPSVRCFVTPFNGVEIWQAIKAERDPPEAAQSEPKAWLLWRNPERLTEFRSLAVDEYIALKMAMDGASFAELCEMLLEWHSETEVAQRALSILRGWLDEGLVA